MSDQQTNWRQVKVGDLLTEYSERSTSSNQHEVLSVTKDGIFSQREYFKKQIASEDNSGYKVVRRGDAVFSAMNLWMGSIYIVKDQEIGIVSPAYTTMRPTDEIIDTEFLGYFLRGKEMRRKYVQHSQQGASIVRRNLNKDDLLGDKILIPPLPEQKKIAEILSTLDSLIIKMESLFLKKKIYGENLMNEIIKNESTQKIYSAKELIKNGHILKIKDGNHGSQYPRTQEFSKSGIPFINASSINSEGGIDFKNCPFLPETRVKTMNIPPAEAGDVILTHNATVGKVTIIPPEIDKVVVSTSTTYYRLNQKLLNNNYLAAFLKSPIYQTQLLRIMGQTTRNQVPITAQKELKISVPSMLVQEKISSIYKLFSRDLKLQLSKLNKLKLLKQSLSNDLLSGLKKITY